MASLGVLGLLFKETPGRIQKVGPPSGSIFYTIGVSEYFYFLDPPGALGKEEIGACRMLPGTSSNEVGS